MRRSSKSMLFALSLVTGLCAKTLADEPSASSEKKVDPRDDTSQFAVTANLTGKLTAVDQDAKTFTLKVTVKVPVVNKSAVDQKTRLVQQITEAERDAQKAKDPKDRANKINRIGDLQNQLFQNEKNLVKIEEKSQDYQLQAHEDMKVRQIEDVLPAAFDEKGQRRKYTEEELKELRDTAFPKVYRAAWSDVMSQQMVTVYIGSKKGDTPAKQPSPSDPKDPKAAPPRLTVMMLVIVGKPG